MALEDDLQSMNDSLQNIKGDIRGVADSVTVVQQRFADLAQQLLDLQGKVPDQETLDLAVSLGQQFAATANELDPLIEKLNQIGAPPA